MRPNSQASPTPPLILVVDDDPVIRRLIADLLAEEGYEVATAGDGGAALRWLDEQRAFGRRDPDAILLDMKMPVVDGWQFAAAYRARPGPHARIVVLTAAARTASWAAEIGADGVLPKPFELDELLAAVQSQVGNAARAPTND
jgi:two-component system chemotaxis response regulator CheY